MPSSPTRMTAYSRFVDIESSTVLPSGEYLMALLIRFYKHALKATRWDGGEERTAHRRQIATYRPSTSLSSGRLPRRSPHMRLSGEGE